MEFLHGIDKYYQYSLSLCHRIRFGNGTETNKQNCTQVPLEECSLSKHFQTKTQYEYFKLYNFTSMRCINYEWWKQNQLLIGGTINSRDLYYLNLFVTVCHNTTLFQSCSSKTEIDKSIQSAIVMSYISSSQIDHSQKGNPYSMRIKSSQTSISQMFQKTQRVTYSAQKTLTDSGYISNQIQEQDTIVISDVQEYTDQISSQQIMFNQILLLDDMLQVAIREYDKISKIIGLIGGLFSVLYQFVYTICHPIILAELKLNLVKWITKKNIPDANSNEDQPLPYLKRKGEQIKNIFKVMFGIKIQDQNNLDLILKLLDINYLIEKILEIDKLKFILFEDEQYHLFNQLPMINQNTNRMDEKFKKQQSLIRSNFLFFDQIKTPPITIPNISNENRALSKARLERNELSLEEIEEGKTQKVRLKGQKSGSGGVNSSRLGFTQIQVQSPSRSPAQETILSLREQTYRQILPQKIQSNISDNNQE